LLQALCFTIEAYIVKWKSNFTGEKGQSEPILDKKLAYSSVTLADRTYPEVEHWIQTIEVTEEYAKKVTGFVSGISSIYARHYN
ncbi:MAG TPA: hypothetical protein VMW91_07815, partial [Desulfosporosinus sp.]|nr:hypothetical protein [Desulfosporosinus sp.]